MNNRQASKYIVSGVHGFVTVSVLDQMDVQLLL